MWSDIHEKYENLCPLAVIGELSEGEQAMWDAHVIECPSCRAEFDEYTDLLHDKLMLIRPPSIRSKKFSPSDQRELFLSSAENRGFIFSDTRTTNTPKRCVSSFAFRRHPRLALAALLIFFAAIGTLSYLVIQTTKRNRALTLELAESKRDRSSLERRVEQLSKSELAALPQSRDQIPLEPVVRKAQMDQKDSANQYNQLALNDARAENETLLSRYNALQTELETARKQLDALKNEANARQISSTNLETELKAAQSNLAKLNEEIGSLQNGRSNDLSTMSAQDAQVKELSDRLRDQNETLNRERKLLAADRDIRELMTARNLHIIDVYDVDEKGKSKRTFGRAFYTEGRSLIFYAFDLDDTRITKANYSLQAWGYQQSTARSVQSLGIFYVDDQKKNRWALKFDDPAVLAQIDSVFVTIEPPGGSKKPRGERLLYAYLKNQPNHP